MWKFSMFLFFLKWISLTCVVSEKNMKGKYIFIFLQNYAAGKGVNMTLILPIYQLIEAEWHIYASVN